MRVLDIGYTGLVFLLQSYWVYSRYRSQLCKYILRFPFPGLTGVVGPTNLLKYGGTLQSLSSTAYTSYLSDPSGRGSVSTTWKLELLRGPACRAFPWLLCHWFSWCLDSSYLCWSLYFRWLVYVKSWLSTLIEDAATAVLHFLAAFYTHDISNSKTTSQEPR